MCYLITTQDIPQVIGLHMNISLMAHKTVEYPQTLSTAPPEADLRKSEQPKIPLQNLKTLYKQATIRQIVNPMSDLLTSR